MSVKVFYNNVGQQNLTSARQLTVEDWNNTINSLALQGNENAKYIQEKAQRDETINDEFVILNNNVSEYQSNVNTLKKDFDNYKANVRDEHDYYLNGVTVSDDNKDAEGNVANDCTWIWQPEDCPITELYDGLTITFIAPYTTTHDSHAKLKIADLASVSIYTQAHTDNDNDKCIIMKGTLLHLIYVASKECFLCMNNTTPNVTYGSSDLIDAGVTFAEGSIWYDTTKNK